MKRLIMNRKIVVLIVIVIVLIYGLQSISYGQGSAPTVEPLCGNNTSLVTRFQVTLDEGVDENAYQIQLRRKIPQGEWISKCVVIKRGNRTEITGDPDVSASTVYHSGYFVLWIWHSGHYSDKTFNIRAIFTDLEPGITYEARYRDTNESECVEDPPAPASWSVIAEGTTYLVTPPPTFTLGENNTSLIVVSPKFCSIYEQKTYQVQLRQKSPQGEWITICTSSWPFRTIFADLEPGTTYEARYRDTNESECVEDPPAPASWSAIAEGTTYLVAPPRAEFVDAKLARILRRYLGLQIEGGHIDLLKIPLSRLSELTELDDVDDAGITDLTGLEHVTQLTDLDLSNNQISDITPLGSLTQLTDLDLSENQISDITPLGSLTQLTDLDLSENQISDITPLAGFSELKWLYLSRNQISNVIPLTNLLSLRVYPLDVTQLQIPLHSRNSLVKI